MDSLGLARFVEPTQAKRQEVLEQSITQICEDDLLKPFEDVFKEAQGLPDKLLELAAMSDWII